MTLDERLEQLEGRLRSMERRLDLLAMAVREVVSGSSTVRNPDPVRGADGSVSSVSEVEGHLVRDDA